MFRLRVLGGFAMEGPSGASAPPLPTRRAKAVLAVLAVCGDLSCTRERLLALLWPESDEAHSRHGLRAALLAIRQALGPDAVPSAGDLVRLDPTVVGSDVLAFRQALASGRPADAVRAYGGALLEGFHVDDAPQFERWLDGERTRLARECAEALERLATAAERAGAWDEAAGWWGRAVEHDPLNSHLVLQHVQALAVIGDRANAIKAADAHTRRLRAELDLEPDREVLAKIERIRRGELPSPRDVPRLPPGAPADRPPTAAEVRTDRAPQATPSGGTTPTPARPTTALGRLPRWVPWAAGVAAVVVLAGAVWVGRWLTTRTAEGRPPRTSIAVLPFANLSPGGPQAYFAPGLHDELITQLAKVAALTVIGRTSALTYAGSTKRLNEIGQELAVGSIVEGSVQVVGNRLRVNVQLIDAATEVHLWAQHYDSTVDDAFAVQRDIAQRIVEAVGATLTRAEAGAIAAAPPANPEAYRLYLQGRDYWTRAVVGSTRQNWGIAQQFFVRALALDSGFALAHAALSEAHGFMYWFRYDPSPSQLALQREEAEVALRLAPSLPEAHFAMALVHFFGPRDYRRALDEFRVAREGLPNDAVVSSFIGYAQRHLGNWKEVLAAFERATQLDPRSADLFYNLGGITYRMLHRYADAVSADDRALSLAPDFHVAAVARGWTYVHWQGQLDTLRAALSRVPRDADLRAPGTRAAQDVQLLYLERQADSLLRILATARVVVFESRDLFLPASLYSAWAHQLRRDRPAARAAFDSARVLLDSVIRGLPDDWRMHAARGLALAGLGRRDEALREARWLEQSAVYREDAFDGPALAEDRARILAQAGDLDAALNEIERLLARPSWLSVHALRLDPRWDPIRNDPRFKALLARYGSR